LNHLRDDGLEVTRRYRPSEEIVLKDRFLFHTLALNNIFIAATLLAREAAAIELVGLRHDLDLKRAPVKLETGRVDPKSGEKELESVSPDGWLNFQIQVPGRDRPVSAPLLLEIDRNTEPVKRIKRKIRGLLAYVGDPYAAIFGTRYVTVSFLVEEAACPSPEAANRRVRDLVRWIEETLAERDARTSASVFLVGSLPHPDVLSPREFFLQPRAMQPFSDLPLSLLDLPDSVPATGADGRSMSFPVSLGHTTPGSSAGRGGTVDSTRMLDHVREQRPIT
jgi:hypothetical protein